MKYFCLVSAALFVLFAGVTSAAASTLPLGMTAIPLAVITNDRDTSVSRIELMLGENATVRGIYMETRASAASDPSTAKGQVYTLKGIESPAGVVLGQGQGHKAILMHGKITAHDGHGTLVISYLKNGIFRHYKECRVNLKRVAPHHWQLVNAYDGHPVARIRVKTWALGISTLANVCPGTRG